MSFFYVVVVVWFAAAAGTSIICKMGDFQVIKSFLLFGFPKGVPSIVVETRWELQSLTVKSEGNPSSLRGDWVSGFEIYSISNIGNPTNPYVVNLN